MVLRVERLTVRYGGLAAVSDVDIEIADGEVLALLGPSGCGKSTLLRAIAGLERPASGVVRWDGADLAGVPVHRRGFGLVFQDGQLFPHRDVVGNVAFGLRMAGTPAPRRADRVTELLDALGLGGYQRRRVTELSGGEQQRVALARALAPRPRLLLLDEPLSSLDRALRDQLAVDLADVLRASGTTALVVTHDHDEAFTLAGRVAVMRAGQISQVGPPAAVWRAPADEATARFLGCVAIVPATVRAGVVHCGYGEAPLPWAPDGEIRLGLRPTSLRHNESGPLAGEVTHRLHRSDHVRLRVTLDSGAPVDAVTTVTADAAPGTRIHLTLDPTTLAILPT